MLVPKLTRPKSQFNAEESNEMARLTSPPDSVAHNDYEGPQAKILNLILTKQSTPMKDVCTTVDKTTIPV